MLKMAYFLRLLALHDGHPFNHSGECACVPATCDVPAQAPSTGATRRGSVRRTPGQRSSIRRLGALRARHGCIAVRLEGSRVGPSVGSKGAVYVVPAQDVSVFTLGRFPRNPVLGAAVKAAAERSKRAFRARQADPHHIVSDRKVGVNFRDLRIASMTGAVRIEWDGATTSWRIVEPPPEAPVPSRLELARRFRRSVGPSTPGEFAWWSGGWAGSFGESTRGELSDAKGTFLSLKKELAEVEFEGRKGGVLRTDRSGLERAEPSQRLRMLPAGDPFLASPDRAFLVPQIRFRSELWPKSVWPGALLVNGELVGAWRRQLGRVTVRAWRPLGADVKEAVEEEVSGIPIESARKEVRWSTGDAPLRVARWPLVELRRCDCTSCLSLVVLRMALHPPLLLLVGSERKSDRPEEHPGGRGAHVLELVLEILQELTFALPEALHVPLHRTVFLRQVQNRLGVLDRRTDFLFVPDDCWILHQRPDVALR